jgi:hypothetical protein
MLYRLSKPLARKLAGATILGGLVLVGLSPQKTLVQGADVGTRSGAAIPEQSAPNATEPSQTPAPENRANQPPFDPIAARTNYLHERLRITPAQEPLWAKVAQVMRENAKAVAPLIKERFQSAQHGNAIDSLNSYEKLGEAQLDGLKKFVAAFEALYNSLSAEQKKIADSIFRLGPLSMIGSIPQLAENLIAPAPYRPYYPSYTTLPPPYPVYPYYPAYHYYPYYRPWFWGPPIGLGVSPFFFYGHHHFQHIHRFHQPGHHR